ncbi:MAG: hypothetical protein ACNYNY_02855 [Candidatus Oxydemutatoraceae bacterium WSBS_2016_MAG_OTU14]
MDAILELGIGTLLFFAFSLLVGIVLTFQAVCFCSKETKMHRIIQGMIGIAYTIITVIAFTQIQTVDVLLSK